MCILWVVFWFVEYCSRRIFYWCLYGWLLLVVVNGYNVFCCIGSPPSSSAWRGLRLRLCVCRTIFSLAGLVVRGARKLRVPRSVFDVGYFSSRAVRFAKRCVICNCRLTDENRSADLLNVCRVCAHGLES